MRVACEVDVVADALWRVAVVAYAVCQTRSLDVEACRINRTCRRACPCQCALNILCHLVEPHDEYHVLGSEGYRCHAVAVAVDVHYHAVFAYGVDARQIVVARKSLAVNLLRLVARLGLVAVEHLQVSFVQGLCQPHVPYGHRAAPRNAAPVGNHGRHSLHGLGRCGAVTSLKIAAFQVLDHLCSELLVAYLFRCHNVSVIICLV